MKTFAKGQDETVHRVGGWSNRMLGRTKSFSIQTGEDDPYLIITDGVEHAVMTFDKDQAVRMAQTILKEFSVPFCNRVPDATS